MTGIRQPFPHPSARDSANGDWSKSQSGYNAGGRWCISTTGRPKRTVSDEESGMSENHPTSATTKVCSSCGSEQPITRFYRRHGDARSACKKCSNRQSRLAQSRWNRKQRSLLKSQIHAHYGNKCACCGESHPEFLCIDHVNNDGAAHRQSLRGTKYGGGNGMYRWIIDHGFPATLRLLCHNCNMARGLFGYCPHEYPNGLPDVPDTPLVDITTGDEPEAPAPRHTDSRTGQHRQAVWQAYAAAAVAGRCRKSGCKEPAAPDKSRCPHHLATASEDKKRRRAAGN